MESNDYEPSFNYKNDESVQDKFNAAVLNEFNSDNQNFTRIADMNSYESFILQKIDYFNSHYEDFFNSPDEGKKFEYLVNFRRSIKVSKKVEKMQNQAPLKFTQRFDIINIFISILIRALGGTNPVINIEILRLFSRMSRAYYGFLNPNNIGEYAETMRKRLVDENFPVRHFAALSLGKTIRQSKEWAIMLFPRFEQIFMGFKTEYHINMYHQQLRLAYSETLDRFISPNFSQTFSFQIKTINPYYYALRSYTKMICDKGLISSQVIGEIIDSIFKTFYEQVKERKDVDVFSTSERLKIFNDIVHADFQGTFEQVKAKSTMFDPVIKRVIFESLKTFYLSLIPPCLKLIRTFFDQGERYANFFDTFPYEPILNILLLDALDPKYSSCAGKCIYSIINAKHEEGFDYFFSKEESSEQFKKIFECAISENTPYKKRITFYNLIAIILRYYTKPSIPINVNQFVEISISLIGEEDYNLSNSIIIALLNMYSRLSILNMKEQFVGSFTQNDGAEMMKQIITNEEGLLYQNAVALMDTLMKDGVPCAQL